jgi:hypothetical protein
VNRQKKAAACAASAYIVDARRPTKRHEVIGTGLSRGPLITRRTPMRVHLLTFGLVFASAAIGRAGDAKKDNTPPPGFTALFSGKDLTGWQGLAMAPDPANKKRQLPLWLVPTDKDKSEAIQKAANDKVLPHWQVKEGVIEYDGKANSLQTVKQYGNFELYVDWKIHPGGDSGIYVRGNPQIQIWDPEGKNNPKKAGSGGLFNNQKNRSTPLVTADNPPGQWNTFWIKMVGDKVTIKLNGKLVVDNTPLENYWHRGEPLPPRGPIELQHHGDHLWFKNIYVKELPD